MRRCWRATSRAKARIGMSAPANPPSRSGWRRWLYRLTAATLVPALFFGLVELSLRICGFGDPTAFFLDGSDVGAPGCLVENRIYGRRFFPTSLVHPPEPLQFAIPAVKPAGTY